MIKNCLIISLAVILLALSCSPEPGKAEERSTVAVVRKIQVESGGDQILIDNLRSGRMYTIYTNPSTLSSLAESKNTTTELKQGTYIMKVRDGESSLTINPEDIGLEYGGSLLIGEIDAAGTVFQDAEDGMRAGAGITGIVYANDSGLDVYEEFFLLDTSTIPSPENVAFILTVSGGGSGTIINHRFGFLDEDGNRISDSTVESVIDLSGYDSVYIYLHLEASPGRNVSIALYPVIPETIDEETVISGPSIYMLEPESRDTYLILSKTEDIELGHTDFVNDAGGRYAADGKRFPQFFPIADTEDAIIMNVNAHDEAVLFDYEKNLPFTASLVPADGSVDIKEMGTGTQTFTVEEGRRLLPVKFSPLTDVRITFSSADGSGSFRVGAGHTDGHGFATSSAREGETVTIEENQILEYGYFFRGGKNLPETEFTITVQ